MKISPLAAGASVTTNPNIGSTASAEKLAAAKAIAAGLKPEEKEEALPAQKALDIRKITMKTNFSTNREEPQLEAQPEAALAQDATNSTTSDESGQTNAAVESTQPLSPQFAALAKERRALQVMKREIEQEKAKLANPEGDYVSKTDLISNPLKIFDLGVTHDQLTKAILENQGGLTPEVVELRNELKALKEGIDSRFTTQQEAQEESALNQIADDIEALSKEGDEFEMFRERNGLERALSKIYSHYKKTGQVLNHKDVMSEIETQLLEEAVKFASLKKVKSKLAPEPVQEQEPKSQGNQMRTLTNRDSAAVPLDRRARAIAAMRGTLRK